MKLSPIQTPDGRPIFSMGGQQSFQTFNLKGFVVSLEWVGNGKRTAACMVIWPESNVFVAGEGAGAWCISRNAITEFVGFTPAGKCTGGPSEHCFREAREALPVLGKDINDKQALMALVDVVVRCAPDLVHMPVTPQIVKEQLDNPAMWTVEATNKASGKTIHEGEV